MEVEGRPEMTADAGDKPVRDGAGPPVAERITVALVRKAGEDLQRIQDRSGLSKTDIVNRAISVYEFIDSQMQAGNDLFVRNQETGETQLVRFLLRNHRWRDAATSPTVDARR
jgi:hypothetical protein